MTDATDGTDRWTDRLSDYLDGELLAAEAEALERHLAGCEACAHTLEELRAVVSSASALEPSAPPRDLWLGIAARIGIGKVAGPGERDGSPAETRAAPASEPGAPATGTLSLVDAGRRKERRTRRLFTLSLPQLAAAAVALMVLSGGVVWMARSGGPTSPDAGVVGLPGAAARARLAAATDGADPRSSTLARYQAAIAELETAIFYGGERLDTATVRKIRESLQTIDRAIAEARRALQEDPSDPYVNRYLAETMRRKVELLQQTAVLAVARG